MPAHLALDEVCLDALLNFFWHTRVHRTCEFARSLFSKRAAARARSMRSIVKLFGLRTFPMSAVL